MEFYIVCWHPLLLLLGSAGRCDVVGSVVGVGIFTVDWNEGVVAYQLIFIEGCAYLQH